MSRMLNLWDDVTVVCGNHGEEMPKLHIQEGQSVFYACPKFWAQNRADKEPVCFNRINLIEYTKMLDHIGAILAEAEENDEVRILTNYTWKSKSITFTIVSHVNNKIVVKMVNEAALQGRLV